MSIVDNAAIYAWIVSLLCIIDS